MQFHRFVFFMLWFLFRLCGIVSNLRKTEPETWGSVKYLNATPFHYWNLLYVPTLLVAHKVPENDHLSDYKSFQLLFYVLLNGADINE